MAYKVRAGDLRQRITVTQIISANNANGFPVEQAGAAVCACWAAARDVSGSDSYDAGTETLSELTEFTVRYRTDIEPGMRVSLGTAVYKIIQVNKGAYGKDFIVLTCKRMKAVSG